MTVLLSATVRIIAALLSAWMVQSEKLYFARYFDTEKDATTYCAHTALTGSVAKCVEKCKSFNECRYINYHVASHECCLISVENGINSSENDVNLDGKVEQKNGYVFGNKVDWTLKIDSGCLVCAGDGTCTTDSRKGTVCPVSGCGPPDSKPHAVAVGNMFDVGNIVAYECLGNRKMAGSKRYTSTCLRNGTWSATDFLCLYDCGSAPSVKDGKVILDSSGISPEGATAIVTCNTGYTPAKSTITCQTSGTWETPECKGPYCGSAPSVKDGKVILDSSGISPEGATAIVTCNTGYTPAKSTITCQTSGTWETPECKGPIFTCTGSTWKYAVSAVCGSCVAECLDGVDELICSCTEDLKQFITLPNYHIKNRNVGNVKGIETAEDCMESCRAKPGCKCADYFHGSTSKACYFNKVMPHEVGPLPSDNADLLLRKCDSCYVNKK